MNRTVTAAVVACFMLVATGSATAATPRPIDAACPEPRVPDSGFTDIARNTFTLEIDCIAWWRIASGRSPTTYGPTAVINRAQMATFLAHLVTETDGELPASPPDAFRDDDGSTHERNIDALAAVGIVQGTGPRTYNPSAAVTRDQMATFLVRTYESRTNDELAASRDHFADDNGSPHEGAINKVAEAGIAAGDTSGSYRPRAGVRRDQMAAFVARTLDLLVDTGHGSLPPPPSAILAYDLERVSSDVSCCTPYSGFTRGTHSISGTQHERALGRSMGDRDDRTHITGEEYDLGRAYARFTATVGQADSSGDTTDTLRFLVFGDGEELQRVEGTFGQEMAIDVDVTGVLRLRIEAQNLSTDETRGDAIAVWGTPTVR